MFNARMRRLGLFLTCLIIPLTVSLLHPAIGTAQTDLPATIEPTSEPTTEPTETLPDTSAGDIQLTIEPPVSDFDLDGTMLAVDVWLDTWFPVIEQTEHQYYKEHGEYWQGLDTHSSTPDYAAKTDGAAYADKLDSKPTNESDDWLAVIPDLQTEKLPATIAINVYDGPDGAGYEVVASFAWNGVLYSRTVSRGPEDWRDHSWTKMVIEAGGQ